MRVGNHYVRTVRTGEWAEIESSVHARVLRRANHPWLKALIEGRVKLEIGSPTFSRELSILTSFSLELNGAGMRCEVNRVKPGPSIRVYRKRSAA
jgi:hypothetical protein